MAQTHLRSNPVNTNGELPTVRNNAPDFELVQKDLTNATLASFKGKKKILNIFPSIDTSTCSTSVKTFNEEIKKFNNVIVINISKDLPFAQTRFCDSFAVENGTFLSAFRGDFAQDYGVELLDSPLAGLCARAVVLVDENDIVLYHELVSEISNEPNYQKVLSFLT